MRSYHHLDVFDSARNYDPKKAGVDKDLRYRLGPIEPVLARVDPLLQTPIRITEESSRRWSHSSAMRCWTSAQRAKPMPVIPDSVPSGYPTMIFEECH
jgi:hypothetical protein